LYRISFAEGICFIYWYSFYKSS